MLSQQHCSPSQPPHFIFLVCLLHALNCEAWGNLLVRWWSLAHSFIFGHVFLSIVWPLPLDRFSQLTVEILQLVKLSQAPQSSTLAAFTSGSASQSVEAISNAVPFFTSLKKAQQPAKHWPSCPDLISLCRNYLPKFIGWGLLLNTEKQSSQMAKGIFRFCSRSDCLLSLPISTILILR